MICCVFIISFYSVVGGWCTEYLFKAVSFDFTEGDPESLKTLFSTFSSSVWLPILCHTLFLVLTAGVVIAGVQNGIEKFSKVMMPLLFLIIIGIAVRSMTLPGSGPGIRFLFQPDWSKVTSQTFLAALTSSISMLEVIVAFCMEEFKMKRKAAGLSSSLSYGSWAASARCPWARSAAGRYWARTSSTLFRPIS